MIEPIRSAAFRRKQGSNDVTTDIVLIDGQGRRFAELIGVHNIALPRAQWSAQAV